MRLFFVVLLSCILSLNFVLYSDELVVYSANTTAYKTEDSKILDSLNYLGYYKNEYKDSYLNLRKAILHFQSDSNIVADGIPGKQFHAALNKRLQQGRSFGYNDYVKNPPSTKIWIAINKTKRTLTVYWNNTPIKKYPVALGRKDYVTPEGKYKIKVKVVNPKWSGGGYAEPVNGGDRNNPLGYRWLGLSIGNKNKYGIHGNNNPYSIGQNVSRGCIRMFNSDVNELFKYIKVGTPVWIGSDKALREWGVFQYSNI